MFDVIAGRADLSIYIMRIIVLLMSLSLHEYWHARTAYKLGDDTASLAGRLTLNPAAHLDPLGTLFIVMGAPVGWAKPVPVNPSRFRRDISMKKGFSLVSAAGPLSNLALSVAGAFFYYVTAFLQLLLFRNGSSGFAATLAENANVLFYLFFVTNIMLAVFNLLPVPPLDGSKILAGVLPAQAYNWLMRNERYIGIGFLLVFVMSPRLIGTVIGFVANPIISIIDFPLNALYNWLISVL